MNTICGVFPKLRETGYTIISSGIPNGKLVINDTDSFSAKQILDCGQIFRYKQRENYFEIYSENYVSHLNSYNDRVIIDCGDVDRAVTFFDLKRDYGLIKSALSGRYELLDEAIRFGGGIRILNQNPTEMIISFIISANNNIPRIKGIIERLCEGLGEDMGGYHGFPTAERLASASENFYRSIGCGYRASYLTRTSRVLADGFDAGMDGVDTLSARKRLMTLTGVGGKVADCILLFGYHRTDVFPVDVWSERIYRSLGIGSASDPKNMAKELVESFGDLAGYAQQYLYYYFRENDL